jgi:hypothetical protein
VTATTHRALVLGPPLVLGLLALGHPGVMPGTPIAATLAPFATWWTVLHVAQVPLFALLGTPRSGWGAEWCCPPSAHCPPTEWP